MVRGFFNRKEFSKLSIRGAPCSIIVPASSYILCLDPFYSACSYDMYVLYECRQCDFLAAAHLSFALPAAKLLFRTSFLAGTYTTCIPADIYHPRLPPTAHSSLSLPAYEARLYYCSHRPALHRFRTRRLTDRHHQISRCCNHGSQRLGVIRSDAGRSFVCGHTLRSRPRVQGENPTAQQSLSVYQYLFVSLIAYQVLYSCPSTT